MNLRRSLFGQNRQRQSLRRRPVLQGCYQRDNSRVQIARYPTRIDRPVGLCREPNPSFRSSIESVIGIVCSLQTCDHLYARWRGPLRSGLGRLCRKLSSVLNSGVDPNTPLQRCATDNDACS